MYFVVEVGGRVNGDFGGRWMFVVVYVCVWVTCCADISS